MLRLPIIVIAALMSACSSDGPVLDTTSPSFVGEMPVDFSGSWERDYTRSQDVQGALNALFYSRQRQMQQSPGTMPGPGGSAGLSQREVNGMIALAQLIDEISRPDVLTISQDDFEVRVAREDDFALSCTFHDGVARGTESPYGIEVCTWQGSDLVSHLVLPDDLVISRRYTMSEDGLYLREITTATSSATRSPLVLQRFYTRFEAPARAFNCIETLSMKRVCSTGELEP